MSKIKTKIVKKKIGIVGGDKTILLSPIGCGLGGNMPSAVDSIIPNYPDLKLIIFT